MFDVHIVHWYKLSSSSSCTQCFRNSNCRRPFHHLLHSRKFYRKNSISCLTLRTLKVLTTTSVVFMRTLSRPMTPFMYATRSSFTLVPDNPLDVSQRDPDPVSTHFLLTSSTLTLPFVKGPISSETFGTLGHGDF